MQFYSEVGITIVDADAELNHLLKQDCSTHKSTQPSTGDGSRRIRLGQ